MARVRVKVRVMVRLNRTEASPRRDLFDLLEDLEEGKLLETGKDPHARTHPLFPTPCPKPDPNLTHRNPNFANPHPSKPCHLTRGPDVITSYKTGAPGHCAAHDERPGTLLVP